MRLGVNIDHVATVRQARQTYEPDPVAAAFAAEMAGADLITIHLREDRRHIQDRDLKILRQTVQTQLNLEMAATDEMVEIALEHLPDQVTIVPERRQEITTEGGLQVKGKERILRPVIEKLQTGGIEVSLFVDPIVETLGVCRKIGASAVELHTGKYANCQKEEEHRRELEILAKAAQYSASLGLDTHAGHGLTYHNVLPVARIPEISELNIGHSIVSRAVFVGMETAVADMVRLIKGVSTYHGDV